MFEFYPDLYEKILKREPNAYLAMMYWDSDMFRRNTSSGKDKDGNSENSVSDIKKASYAGLTEFRKRDAQHAKQLESFLTTKGSDLTDAGWKVVLEIVTAGDPKGRTIRRLYTMMK